MLSALSKCWGILVNRRKIIVLRELRFYLGWVMGSRTMTTKYEEVGYVACMKLIKAARG